MRDDWDGRYKELVQEVLRGTGEVLVGLETSELSQELWLRAAGAGTSWFGYFVNLSDLVPELSRVGRLIPRINVLK